MNLTTIFFIDNFLNGTEQQTNEFFTFLHSLKEQHFAYHLISCNMDLITKYPSHSIHYISTRTEEISFLKRFPTNNTLVISDCESFLSRCNESGFICIGFSHTKEFLPTKYCFEDFSGIDMDYFEYIHHRCQHLPITIATTKNLKIREFCMDDMPGLFALYQNEENLQYVFQREPNYHELCAKFSSYINEIYPFYDYGLWAVLHKETGVLIGEFGLQCNQIDSQEEIELGYLLHPLYQGKGYACQAIRAIFRYARDILGFDRIVASIHSQNKASIAVSQKCGMHFEKNFQFHGEPFSLYVINVQTDRFFAPKKTSKKSTVNHAYQAYQNNPDTSVYAKRYSK